MRSQTFVHWSGFSKAVAGSVYSGLAHVSDWGVTLVAALGHSWEPNPGQAAPDGFNLWPALVAGSESPRTEVLLSMRDVGECRSVSVFILVGMFL